jgi:apolipoprotein N-acyltransferase
MSSGELAQQQDLVRENILTALAHGATTVVLPEDTRLGYGHTPEEIYSWFAHASTTGKGVIVDSYRTQTASTTALLRGYTYDLAEKQTYTSDKTYLVPGGEFVPYIFWLPLKFFGSTATLAHMQYVRGDAQVSEQAPSYIPEVLYCFEGGATEVVRGKSLRHTDLIAHPVSHSWFHTPVMLWNQERQMLIVQSLFTKRPILQAGNNAPSVLYTPDGRVHTGTIVTHAPNIEVKLYEW